MKQPVTTLRTTHYYIDHLLSNLMYSTLAHSIYAAKLHSHSAKQVVWSLDLQKIVAAFILCQLHCQTSPFNYLHHFSHGHQSFTAYDSPWNRRAFKHTASPIQIYVQVSDPQWGPLPPSDFSPLEYISLIYLRCVWSPCSSCSVHRAGQQKPGTSESPLLPWRSHYQALVLPSKRLWMSWGDPEDTQINLSSSRSIDMKCNRLPCSPWSTSCSPISASGRGWTGLINELLLLTCLWQWYWFW